MYTYITNAYRLNNPSSKITNYKYKTTDVAERNETPLIDYYDGNWVRRSSTDDSIIGYDNRGLTLGAINSSYDIVRSQSIYDATISSFYLMNVPQGSGSYATDLVFNYYGNYAVTFIPIPAHRFLTNSSNQTTRVDTNFYIPIARVKKDLTLTNTHWGQFSVLRDYPYLRGEFVDYSVDSDVPSFTYWRLGGTYYGYKDRCLCNYYNLGNIFSDLEDIYVPQNKDGFILSSFSKGVAKNVALTKIKSVKFSNSLLKYFATGPMKYNYNNVDYIIEPRFLPYPAEIYNCWRYYTRQVGDLNLENLVSFDSSTREAVISFNNHTYRVMSSSMLHIGLDEFLHWYKDLLDGVGDGYIVNRHHTFTYETTSVESEETRIYPDCDIDYCQAIVNEIKRLYNDSAFDIQLYENGFYASVTEPRYQAGKFLTRNIQEQTTITTKPFFPR